MALIRVATVMGLAARDSRFARLGPKTAAVPLELALGQLALPRKTHVALKAMTRIAMAFPTGVANASRVKEMHYAVVIRATHAATPRGNASRARLTSIAPW